MTAARKKTADDSLTVGLAQIAPVWLNREKTLVKVAGHVEQAAAQGCRLVAFGEALVPGYPFWIERTDGARFNSPVQKELHAYYAIAGRTGCRSRAPHYMLRARICMWPSGQAACTTPGTSRTSSPRKHAPSSCPSPA
jgi:hypothetical protein